MIPQLIRKRGKAEVAFMLHYGLQKSKSKGANEVFSFQTQGKKSEEPVVGEQVGDGSSKLLEKWYSKFSIVSHYSTQLLAVWFT